MSYAQLASFLFGLFAQQGKVYLSMDRTNWQWGKSSINILMLSLVYKGTAIPVFTDPERIQKLVGVLAIAFAWSHRVGEWRHEHREPIKVKKHGRLAKSLFRHGLDFIREILFAGKFSIARFRQCLAQLALPPQKPEAKVFIL